MATLVNSLGYILIVIVALKMIYKNLQAVSIRRYKKTAFEQTKITQKCCEKRRKKKRKEKKIEV